VGDARRRQQVRCPGPHNTANIGILSIVVSTSFFPLKIHISGLPNFSPHAVLDRMTFPSSKSYWYDILLEVAKSWWRGPAISGIPFHANYQQHWELVVEAEKNAMSVHWYLAIPEEPIQL